MTTHHITWDVYDGKAGISVWNDSQTMELTIGVREFSRYAPRVPCDPDASTVPDDSMDLLLRALNSDGAIREWWRE